MRRFLDGCLKRFGYRLTPLESRSVTVGGIHFEVDPCSYGTEHDSEPAARDAIRLIRERGWHDLKILDICCGVGVIGLSIYVELARHGIVREVVFSDINIFNLESLLATLRANDLDDKMNGNLRYYLSDALKQIPSHETFDLIVSNPPHYFANTGHADLPSPSRIGKHDEYNFHETFYHACDAFLKDGGETWLMENNSVTGVDTFLPLIEGNPNLEFIEEIPIVNPPWPDPKFYWIVTRRPDREA